MMRVRSEICDAAVSVRMCLQLLPLLSLFLPCDSKPCHHSLLSRASGALAFEPANVTIKSGESVKFVNNAGFPHNVVFDEDAVPVSSGLLGGGRMFAGGRKSCATYTLHPTTKLLISLPPVLKLLLSTSTSAHTHTHVLLLVLAERCER